MRITAFTTCHWNDAEDAARPSLHDPLFGLPAWHARVIQIFGRSESFLACGSWSDPEFRPLRGIEVVNSGMPSGPYDVFRRQFWMGAVTAAMAKLLNSRGWDLAVFLDTDCLVGAVDFKALMTEFVDRSEILLSPEWSNAPGGPIMVWKREACSRFLHQRLQPNIVDESQPSMPLLGENEMGEIFRGRWWNPWPGVNMRQDYSVNPSPANPMEFIDAPFIRQPHPAIIQTYLDTRWSRMVPLQ